MPIPCRTFDEVYFMFSNEYPNQVYLSKVFGAVSDKHANTIYPIFD